MRKIVVSEFVSLDGVMEEPRWTFQFGTTQQNDFKRDELIAADALLLGRVTYEGFAAAWPSAPEEEEPEQMNGIRKHVVSTTLEEPLEWENSTLLEGGDLAEGLSKLKREDGKDILVYGSATLVETLTNHGLVDEYRLMIFPVVVGSGRKLFEGVRQKPLKLTDTQTFPTGVVVLTYEPGDAR